MTFDERAMAHEMFNKPPTNAPRKMTRALFEECNLPQRYLGLTLKSWLAEGGDPEIGEWIRKYIEHLPAMEAQGTGVILAGPNGSGKTGLAALIVQGWLARSDFRGGWDTEGIFPEFGGKRCWFYRMPEIMDYFTAVRKGIVTTIRDMREIIYEADLLIIDDLTGMYAKYEEIDKQHLVDVLKQRAGGKKLTIITTNLKGAALGDLLSPTKDDETGRDIVREVFFTKVVPARVRKSPTEPW